ncbi:MAG: lysylphosphatidylglycerol synthase transmembrane domain-containing protein, partial [Caldilineaceae bacterium]
MSLPPAPPAAPIDGAPPALPALRGAWRRVLVLALLGLLTVALLLTLSGGRQTLAVLGQADWRLLLPAALIHYGGFALRGRRWQLLLRMLGHPLPYWPLTALLLAGWFASALLPARAGDLLRVAALRAGGLGAGVGNATDGAGAPPVPVADALGSIVLERVLDILAILLLGATFGALAFSGSLPRWVLATYGAAVALLLVLGAALLLAPPLMSALRRVSVNRWWQAALGFVEQVVAALRALARAPAVAATTVVLSLLIWMCDALLLWFALGALDAWLPLAQAAFVAFTVDIVAAVPITPGGIGQIEAANTALLALVGV